MRFTTALIAGRRCHGDNISTRSRWRCSLHRRRPLPPDTQTAERPTVFILDFGAQYSQLIARRTRELGAYCEIVPFDTPWSELAPRTPAAFILSGGPESTLVEDAPGIDPAIVTSGVPMIGRDQECSQLR